MLPAPRMNLPSSSRLSDSSYFLSSFAVPPAKRKRVSSNHEEAQASVIKDTRVTPSKALRLNCGTLTVLVGPPPTEIDAAADTDVDADMDPEAFDTRESFVVHELAICDRSPFFANAMKPEWAAGRPDSRVIELPDDDPGAFSLYLSYLYSGKLPILSEMAYSPNNSSLPMNPNGDEDDNEGFHTLSYAYILGERLLDTGFKNAIIDAYVLYARGSPAASHPTKRLYPSNADIRILYSGTTEASPIRRLLVDIWSCRGKWEWVDQDPDLPADFLREVTKALLKTRGNVESLSRPWKNNHDQYHEPETIE